MKISEVITIIDRQLEILGGSENCSGITTRVICAKLQTFKSDLLCVDNDAEITFSQFLPIYKSLRSGSLSLMAESFDVSSEETKQV